MSQTSLKPSTLAWLLFGIVGLISLLILFLRGKTKPVQGQPEQVIRKVLNHHGMPEMSIRFWTAVSAFETAGWKSKVFMESNNLFCIILRSSKKYPNRLGYGEGQTIYPSMEDAAESLWVNVLMPFDYPLAYQSIDEGVNAMKQRGYFQSDQKAYTAGVKSWYDKIYNKPYGEL